LNDAEQLLEQKLLLLDFLISAGVLKNSLLHCLQFIKTLVLLASLLHFIEQVCVLLLAILEGGL
jgi:hypothetical protein